RLRRPVPAVAPSHMVQTALEPACLGCYHVPIMPGEKRPPFRTGRGHADAAPRDAGQLEQWFADGRFDIAIVLWLSGLCAADVDIRPGETSAADELVHLEQRTGHSMRNRWSDETACQTTPQRGWH